MDRPILNELPVAFNGSGAGRVALDSSPVRHYIPHRAEEPVEPEVTEANDENGLNDDQPIVLVAIFSNSLCRPAR